jgi:probable F420-dependent oxidoreductase
MMPHHPFRFGIVAALARSGDEWAEKARRIESLGYATLVVPDNIERSLAPFPALAVAAAATRTLRIGTYVLANDYRHPVLLAKEAASLDRLSNGRFELGIGAGRASAAADAGMLGLTFDPGGVRVARLAEALSIIKPLLSGQRVDVSGTYYRVQGAGTSPLPLQQPLPILVAAAQQRLLALAAREADIIALGVQPHAGETEVAQSIEWIRVAAGERLAALEINMNLMAVAGQVPRYLAMSLGAAAEQLARSDAIPVLKGTTDDMCEQLIARREKFGISYVMVGEELMNALAPVVARLAGK